MHITHTPVLNMLCICSISFPSHNFYHVCNSTESYFHERVRYQLFPQISHTVLSTKSLRSRSLVSCISNIIHYITLSTTTSVQSNAYQLQEEIKWHMAWRYVIGTCNHLKYVALTASLDHSCVCTVTLHLLHKQLKE